MPARKQTPVAAFMEKAGDAERDQAVQRRHRDAPREPEQPQVEEPHRAQQQRQADEMDDSHSGHAHRTLFMAQEISVLSSHA